MKPLAKLLLTVMAIVLLAVATPLPAQAAPTVTIYDQDESGWKAAVVNWETETFDDSSLNPGLGVTATWLNAGVIDGQWYDRLIVQGAYDNETGQWGPTTTTWTFAEPIRAFGGVWNPGGPGGPGAAIKVSIAGSWISVGVIPNNYVGAFWGFVSDVSFTQVLLEPHSSSTGWCETYTLDDMVYSGASICFEPPFLIATTSGFRGPIAKNARQAAAIGFSGYKDRVANPTTGNLGYTIFTWGGYTGSFNVFVPGGKNPNQVVEAEAVLGVEFVPTFTGTATVSASFTLDGEGVGCAGGTSLDYVAMFLPFSIPFIGPSKTLLPTMAEATNQAFVRIDDSVAHVSVGKVAVASELFFPGKMEVDYSGKNVVVSLSVAVVDGVPIRIEAGLVSELKSWGNASMVVNLENSRLDYICVTKD